jgi:hypothetical protein
MAYVLPSFHITYYDWIKEERLDVPAGTVVMLDGTTPVTIVSAGVFPETTLSSGTSAGIFINHVRGSAEVQIHYAVQV